MPIELVDGDGDTVTNSIGVTLTPPGQVIQDFSPGIGVTPVIGAANPHIIGSEFNDTLNGDLSLNTLFGNAGNDIISGDVGNDVLIGGAGNDPLTGGTGIDRMIFEEVGVANQDTINLYLGTGADRDILDLSGLLDATFSNGNNIANFVQITDTGADARVRIDATGTGNLPTRAMSQRSRVTARSAVSSHFTSRARSIRFQLPELKGGADLKPARHSLRAQRCGQVTLRRRCLRYRRLFHFSSWSLFARRRHCDRDLIAQ